MKISFLSIADFANVLTEYSYCLNKHSDDIVSKSICIEKHPYNYTTPHDYDLSTYNKKDIEDSKKFLLESDYIIFSEEYATQNLYTTIEKFSSIYHLNLFDIDAKFCIWHPGTCYRDSFRYYNIHPLRDKIFKHFYAIDLYRLSPKNNNDLPLLPYQYIKEFNFKNFIDTFKKKIDTLPWTILHIPSKASIKGTSTFNSIISSLNLDPKLFKYKVLQNIPYSEVIKEKEKSLFYLDQINETCGGYGLASLEALLLSNLTFSTINNSSDSLYKLTGKYETPVVPLTSNEEELREILTQFIKNISKESMIEYMQGVGMWIEDAYNPKNIVKQFKELIA
tara:strand:+ start:169 stop:1176 length:1008 start_codon:yes stop_codon:yes gene_type:complete